MFILPHHSQSTSEFDGPFWSGVDMPAPSRDVHPDTARYTDRRYRRMEEDAKSAQDLLQVLKLDRDMRESAKRRTQVRR